MATLKYLLFTVISTCFLWQCATMQSPSGGVKDINAPGILSIKPAQGATNVQTRTIEVQFDEYIKLNNLQGELLISPPLENKPLISQKGKNLFIEILEDLKEDNTYTFNFGNGIADFHEGNVLKDFTLVFSTGKELDSLAISGKLRTCLTNKTPENIIVGAYKSDSLKRDSIIYLQKPNYFGLVNEKGEYKIEHIKAGKYELIAFEDVNTNYLYDGAAEQIAFSDSLITISDRTKVDLWLFKEKDEIKLLDVSARDNGRIHWLYNQEIDSLKIHSSITTDFYSKTNRDSLFVWPQYNVDSFYIWTEIDSRLDSILVKNDSLKTQELSLTLENKYLKAKTNLVFQSDAPIIAIDTTKIELFVDSVRVDYSIIYSDFNLELKFLHGGKNNYNLTLHKGAVLSTYSNQNDSTYFTFHTKHESALAGLDIKVNSIYKNFYIELLKDDKVIETLSSVEDLKFTNLLPSRYQVRMVIDRNLDGKWTPGNYFENKQPERVIYYDKEINLRANWELEIDWLVE